MLAYCTFNGIGVIPWSPLHFGYLARPLDAVSIRKKAHEEWKGTLFEYIPSDADKEIIKRVEEVAKKRGWKMAQVALAWAGAKVTSPIVGMNSIQRVGESVVRGLELSEEEMRYLEEP